MVARQMEMVRSSDPNRRKRYFAKIWLLLMAMWVPTALYTWMLGKTLVQVSVVEGSYGCAENVLVRVDDRAEVGTVVEEGTDDQAQGHAGKQEGTHFVVVFFAAEQEENQCSCYVEEPQKVWYDEVFIKWDQVV